MHVGTRRCWAGALGYGRCEEPDRQGATVVGWQDAFHLDGLYRRGFFAGGFVGCGTEGDRVCIGASAGCIRENEARERSIENLAPVSMRQISNRAGGASVGESGWRPEPLSKGIRSRRSRTSTSWRTSGRAAHVGRALSGDGGLYRPTRCGCCGTPDCAMRWQPSAR